MKRTLTSVAIVASVLGGAPAAAGQARDVLVQDAPEGEPGAAPSNGEATDGEGRGGRRGGCSLGAVPEAIGISQEELRAELDAGQSIANVAEADGVSAEIVVDAKLAEAEARAEARVDEIRGAAADDGGGA